MLKTDNETLSVIRKRWSCKDYTGKAPAKAQLQQIAEAGIQAPSVRNLQRWRVIVVTDKTLMDEMEEEATSILKSMPEKTVYEKIMASGKGLFYGAPTMMVIPMEASSQPMEVMSAALDCGILCENLALAATSLGVGNLMCGLAGLAFAGDKATYFKDRLGFPEGYEFSVSLLLGEAAAEGRQHASDFAKIQYVE